MYTGPAAIFRRGAIMAFDLRPYQSAALDNLRSALARKSRLVLLYSPTGSGKTEMGMAMIRGAVGKGKRVAFIANRVELIAQASRRFLAAGIPHGILQGQNTIALESQVLICSIQTVAKRGLPLVDLIVVDEAHGCAGSQAYRDLLLRERSLVPVIGLSATPFTRGLGKVFQEIVPAATIRELIDQGYLVDVDVYAPSEPDLSRVKVVAGDYQQTQLGEAVDKPDLVGDIVTHWLKLARGKQTVCFATNIPHSLHIVEQFRAVGVTAEHVDCYTSEEDRAAILGRVARGETTVISNVAILAEGWDCPAVEVMILARPTRSLARFIQMVGRVLRPADGKARALLLDHSGSTAELGYPTDDLPLELDDGKPNQAGRQQKEEPKPKKCPTCSFMKPPKVHACPQCGFEPQRQNAVEVEAGELVKMDRKGKKPASPDRKQHVFSQLLSVARHRGYSSGWVSHKYREMFGVWPRGLNQVEAAPTQELLSWLKSQQIRFAKGREKAEVSHGAA